MTIKTVELVATPREPHYVGDGFRVINYIPSGFRLDMARLNPFIMMDYNAPFYFPPTDQPRGVSVHPHRGFETVTLAYKGKVSHHDSSGGGGTIGKGDVQWMTAASGVLHKEYHEKEWSAQGGIFHMVQLWVNLPAKYKMSPPKYQSILNSSIPKVNLPDNAGMVEVIAGNFNGVSGVASTFSPINMLNIKLNKGGNVNLSFPSHYNTVLLIVEGHATINQTEEAPTDHLVLMANDGENFNITASEDSIVLILSGEPIMEPIAAHGPFVMNTRQEIVQAFEDFYNGKFGYLEE